MTNSAKEMLELAKKALSMAEIALFEKRDAQQAVACGAVRDAISRPL